jgi:hypothetical protein
MRVSTCFFGSASANASGSNESTPINLSRTAWGLLSLALPSFGPTVSVVPEGVHFRSILRSSRVMTTRALDSPSRIGRESFLAPALPASAAWMASSTELLPWALRPAMTTVLVSGSIRTALRRLKFSASSWVMCIR